MRRACLACSVVIVLGCGQQLDTEFDLSEAHIIDVRPRLHWAYEHIEGARHIQWDCIYLGLQVLGVTEHDPVVLYGENSSLVGRAETSLRNMSYARVLNAGSISEASALLGRPIVQPESREPDAIERAILDRCGERLKGLPDL